MEAAEHRKSFCTMMHKISLHHVTQRKQKTKKKTTDALKPNRKLTFVKLLHFPFHFLEAIQQAPIRQ